MMWIALAFMVICLWLTFDSVLMARNFGPAWYGWTAVFVVGSVACAIAAAVL